jgi:hypothetical protein
MIDRNKIAYKIKFYTDSITDNKIFNNVTKEFEPIRYNSFDFNVIKVTDRHIILTDNNCDSSELGFNVLGEIIDNPSNIPYVIDYDYTAVTMFNDNNIYHLECYDSFLSQEFKTNLNDILKTNIINTLELRKLAKNHFVLTKDNIIDKFLHIYDFDDRTPYDLEEYLDKDRCLEYILNNVDFFLKPFNNFKDNEYYLVIKKDKW